MSKAPRVLGTAPPQRQPPRDVIRSDQRRADWLESVAEAGTYHDPWYKRIWWALFGHPDRYRGNDDE